MYAGLSMPELRRDWSVDWKGLALALMAVLCFVLALCMAGCGGNAGGGIRADSTELQAVADEQAEFLMEKFRIGEIDADIHTVPSIDAEGRFRAPDGQLYYGRVLPGFHSPTQIEVSDRLFPGVVRHELLHAAGYTHADKIINGVTVADWVDHWYD